MFIQELNRFSPRCVVNERGQMPFAFDAQVFRLDTFRLQRLVHSATGRLGNESVDGSVKEHCRRTFFIDEIQ